LLGEKSPNFMFSLTRRRRNAPEVRLTRGFLFAALSPKMSRSLAPKNPHASLFPRFRIEPILHQLKGILVHFPGLVKFSGEIALFVAKAT